MSLEKAMNAEVTQDDARREILRHSLDPEDFFRDLGDSTLYSGTDVLG